MNVEELSFEERFGAPDSIQARGLGINFDFLDAYRPLPGNGDQICLSIFLAKAQDLSLPALTRGIAAEGNFHWAVSNRRWHFRLLVGRA